jgi:hypothetical protein
VLVGHVRQVLDVHALQLVEVHGSPRPGSPGWGRAAAPARRAGRWVVAVPRLWCASLR